MNDFPDILEEMSIGITMTYYDNHLPSRLFSGFSDVTFLLSNF